MTKQVNFFFSFSFLKKRNSRKVGIEEPNLRGHSLARSRTKLLLVVAIQNGEVQTLVGRLMDESSLFRVDPLLIFGYGTGNHLDLLVTAAGELADFGARVLPSQLEVLGEREELGGGHCFVARVCTHDITILQIKRTYYQTAEFVIWIYRCESKILSNSVHYMFFMLSLL